MKRISFILMALAMVMGMTQCKKEKIENGTFTPLEGEEVNITLVLGGGSSSDSKVDVNLNFETATEAPVRFEKGDVIWVAYNKRCVGFLTYDETLSNASTATDQNGDKLGVFTGTVTIDQLQTPTPLYFYFLGNKTPYDVNNPTSTTWKAEGASQLTVDLSDQSAELPVISYGISEQTYPTTDNTYTVKYNWLKNQCALVKFTMENIYDKGTAMSSTNDLDQNSNAIYTTTKPITIYGMDNQVTIDLTSPAADADVLWGSNGNWNHDLDASFSWGTKANSDGAITLWSPSANEEVVRYAIVAPKTGYNTPTGKLDVPFDASLDPYGFFGTYRLVGDVANNAFCQDAKIDLVWHSGAFSVASAGTHANDLDISNDEFGTPYYIVFSRGNLQYKCNGAYQEMSTGTYDHWATENSGIWRFAKHQQDFVGGGLDKTSLNQNYQYIGNVVLDETNDASPALDNTSANRSDNEQIKNTYTGWLDLFGWGTGNRPRQCKQENAYYDTYTEWGTNPILNDGTPSTDPNFWYTLGRDEWQYLMEHRCGGSSSASSRIGLAKVNGVKGMILLPDRFNTAQMPAGCGNTWEEAGSHTLVDNSWNMSYSEEQWKVMEKNGAVFLPAAGYRGSKFLNLWDLDFDGGGPTGTGGSDQDHGAYWSSTKATAYTAASSYYMRFGNAIIGDHVNPGYYMAPDNGNAVRLVHRVDYTSGAGSKFFPKKK